MGLNTGLTKAKETNSNPGISNRKLSCSHMYVPSMVGAALLVLIITVFYSGYATNVIPMQTGWIQDIAARMSSGEVIYRDFYWYTPPLFPWLATILYVFFGSNMFPYLIVGYICCRVIPALLVYKVLLNYLRPTISALIVLAGVALSATYTVEQLFDLNPLLLCVTVIQCSLCAKLIHESIYLRRLTGCLILGILSGVQLASKQTGLTIVVACAIILFSCARLRLFSASRGFGEIGLYAVGVISVLVVIFFVLMGQGALEAFLQCMSVASESKGGIEVALNNIKSNMLSIPGLIIALCCCVRLYLSDKAWAPAVFQTIKTGSFFAICACSLLLFAPLVSNVASYLQEKNPIFQFVAVVALALIFVYAGYIGNVCKTDYNEKAKLTTVTLFLLVAFAILFVQPDWRLDKFVEISSLSSIKHSILLLIFYLFVALWLIDLIKIIQGSLAVHRLFLCASVYLGFFSGTLLSASIEELYIMPMLAFTCTRIFSLIYAADDDNQATSGMARGLHLAPALILPFLIYLIIASFVYKRLTPYDWHTWAVDSAASARGDLAETKSYYTKGLAGYSISSTQLADYDNALYLIQQFATPEDEIYQFPSVPLLNVLSNHPSQRYLAEAWFDVAPDSLAQYTAESLYSDPPEFFLMGDMGEGDWATLESVYRGGRPSGQRYIQEFYNTVVHDSYQRIYYCENRHPGYGFSLWIKAPVTSPTATKTAAMNPENAYSDNFSVSSVTEIHEMGVQVNLDSDTCVLSASISANGTTISQGCAEVSRADDGNYVKIDMNDATLKPDTIYTVTFVFSECESATAGVYSCAKPSADNEKSMPDKFNNICCFIK